VIAALIVLAIFALIGLAWVALTYNRFVRAANQQREAWSGIDVQLRKRHDLVPSLVETVRGYRDHESDVFTAVTAARNHATAEPARTDAAENELSQGLTRLLAVAEAYPDLKASENFRTLSTQLTAIENDLQFARRYFNGSVRDFRNLAESFPANLLAAPFGFRPGEFFEVDSATERTAPAVRLS
jgi:LemA protein